MQKQLFLKEALTLHIEVNTEENKCQERRVRREETKWNKQIPQVCHVKELLSTIRTLHWLFDAME